MTYKLITDSTQLRELPGLSTKDMDADAFDQALVDEKTGNVCALLRGTRNLSAKLVLLNSRGEVLADLIEPENFEFSYLTFHPEVGFAIVASSNEKVDGWYDWHFGIDFRNRKLFRHCPAY